MYRSFLVSNVERSPASVSINPSKSIKNTLGHNSPASELCHRKKFIFLTKRVRMLSIACFIMDILMLTAEAFSYPGGHVWMEQAAWIAPSLYTPVNPKPFLVYSLVVNT